MAFADPVVWLTALLAAWTAVLPSFSAHAFSAVLMAPDHHKVRRLRETLQNRSSANPSEHCLKLQPSVAPVDPCDV